MSYYETIGEQAFTGTIRVELVEAVWENPKEDWGYKALPPEEEIRFVCGFEDDGKTLRKDAWTMQARTGPLLNEEGQVTQEAYWKDLMDEIDTESVHALFSQRYSVYRIFAGKQSGEEERLQESVPLTLEQAEKHAAESRTLSVDRFVVEPIWIEPSSPLAQSPSHTR